MHAARHTCATLIHLSGVPTAVLAAWIRHKDATLTMKLYVHSQADALTAAGAAWGHFGSSCVTHVSLRIQSNTIERHCRSSDTEPMTEPMTTEPITEPITGIEPAYSAWEVDLVALPSHL